MLWVLIRIALAHNIGFYEDLTNLFFNYHQISPNMQLISSSELNLTSNTIIMIEIRQNPVYMYTIVKGLSNQVPEIRCACA